MARHEIVMPQMGESITNGTIAKWAKSVGEEIEIDEILLEISTDKVESEIPAPIGGRVAAILFKEGDTVDVGIKIAEIEDDLSATLEPDKKSEEKVTESVVASVGESLESSVDLNEISISTQTSERRFYTPLVKVIAKTNNISLEELANINGTGAGGRVNKRDLENYITNGQTSSAKSLKPSTQLENVQAESSSLKDSVGAGRVEVIPMDNMRKVIAKNMVQSKQISPHVNSVAEADLSHLVKFREGFKEEFFKQEGFKLTYTPFIMYAIIQSLKEFSLVNASIDGDNIVVKKDINLGVAVAVPGNGLMVPVVKNADSLNMTGLCRSINDLALKARAKKIDLDELQGGTFTFTNVGSFGTLLATPIILQPQVGIYASGLIQKRVMVQQDDSIAIRNMMYGTHTYDHRLVDGEMGGKFLGSVHRNLEMLEPKLLF